MHFLTILLLPVALAQTDAQSSVSWTSDDSFKNDILNSTNFFRSQHNATAVTWNDTIADFAKDYSDTSCSFDHSGGPYGENLAAGYENVTAAVDAWGNEGKDYDFSKGDFDENTGHFTQLVWKNTTTVGCGRRNCNGTDGTDGWFLVCEYYPRGNIINYFTQNVQAATSSSTSGSSSGGSGASAASLAKSNILYVSILLGMLSILL